jgi:hypothetical protein
MFSKPIRNLKNYNPEHNFAYRPIHGDCDAIILPDGSTAYIAFEGFKSGADKSVVIQRMLDSLPLYNNQEIAGAPDGIYTWIYTSNSLVASPVFSRLEFGSRHFDIFRRIGIAPEVNVYAAGEFKKEGDTITYNVASGSVTVQLMRKNEKNNYLPENIASVEKNAAAAFATLEGVHPIYAGSQETFINMPLTFEQLEFYESLGYKIDYYKNKDTCELRHKPFRRMVMDARLAVDRDQRMKERMRSFYKNDPKGLEKMLAEFDAKIDASKAQLKELLYFQGGARGHKQKSGRTVRRRTIRRRTLRRHRA